MTGEQGERQSKPRVGVSSCLLGEKVRHDGGHKHDRYVTDVLGKYFDYVPWCPEMGIGLGTPRPTIRLKGNPSAPRALADGDRVDVTRELRAYAERVRPRAQELSGYILKRASPSCGMERVRVYGECDVPVAKGRGIYAARIMELLPLLPVEEEGRLNDPVLLDNFVERVFAYHRWLRLNASCLTPRRLVEFHTRHKFQILAHSEVHYRRLGRLVARAGTDELPELAQTYIEQFMEALKRHATRKRHANALQHLMGYLKRELDGTYRVEMAALLEQYRVGRVPLIVPMTMLRQHLRRHPKAYVELQYYLEPHPDELMLRNSI